MTNKENPWKKVSTRVVYTNPWMTLHEDKVVTPDGSETIYGHIETPTAAAVLAITEDDEVILIGQHRYPVDEYSWEIIAGAVDEGEKLEVAARRELREEAGIECGELKQLGPPIYIANSRSNEQAYIYVARDLSFFEPKPDMTEILTMKRVPFSEALSMVEVGEMTDSISVVAIQRYALEQS